MKLEARVRIELTIEVLQTSALPLGYRAGSYPRKTLKRKALTVAGPRETGAPPLQILNRLAQLRAFLRRLNYSSGASLLTA